MSGLINKVKEAVHSDKKDNALTDNPQSTNAGPHGSNMANVADPRVDSDRDNVRSGAYGTGATGATGAGFGSSTTGATGAGYGSTTTGATGAGLNDPRSTNAGPHSSNIANTADPRVDSDRDGRGLGHGTAGTAGTAYGSSTTGGAGYGSTGAGIGSTGTTGAGYGSSTTGGGLNDPRSTNAGPHSSNMANKADPRVDSDRHGRGVGTTGAGIGSTGTTGAGYGTTGTTGAGIGSTGTTGVGHGTTGTAGVGYGDPRSTNAGPHSSNMANKADPRVDSDLDGGRSGGLGTSGVGHTSHTGYGQGTTGTGIGSTGTTGATGAGFGSSATPGSGNTSKTAGPHNSDLMNKLDPRVDSDMDGSKTMGGNATHR